MGQAAAAARVGDRRAERVSINKRGSLRLAVSVDLLDATALGVRAHSAVPLPAGTIVMLGVGGGASRHAKVIWERDGEIGCEFLSPLTRSELAQLLNETAPAG